MQTQSGEPSEPRMPEPLEILAEEIGAVAGRLEREVRQLVALELEKLGRSVAEARLQLREIESAVEKKLAQLKNGEDGKPGERGERGEQGPAGQSFTVRGLFNPQESYRALDVVSLDGGAFVAKRDNPGMCPGDGWQIIAMRGKTGPKGEAS